MKSKRHVIRNHMVLLAIKRCISELAIDDGSRSPIHLLDKDDSLELDQGQLSDVLQELEDEEARHVQYFENAFKKVSLSDIDGPIILPTQLSDIFKSTTPETRRSVTRQPPCNMHETDGRIKVNVDLPGVEREDIEVFLLPRGDIKISGTR